jgi:restriction system protein
MGPFLKIAKSAKGSEVKLRDVINQLADKFNLTEEERNATIPSGKQSVLDNRVGWARTYLTKSGLLKATRRAHFIITERGAEALASGDTINNEYLKEFDEFVAFKEQKTDDPNDNSIFAAPFITELGDVTPDEALRAAYKTINDALISELLTRTREVTPAFF